MPEAFEYYLKADLFFKESLIQRAQHSRFGTPDTTLLEHEGRSASLAGKGTLATRGEIDEPSSSTKKACRNFAPIRDLAGVASESFETSECALNISQHARSGLSLPFIRSNIGRLTCLPCEKDASVHSVSMRFKLCDNPKRFNPSTEKRSLADLAPGPSGHA